MTSFTLEKRRWRGCPGHSWHQRHKSDANDKRLLRIEAQTIRRLFILIWSSLHRRANRRNLTTSLEGRISSTEYSNATSVGSASNMTNDTRKRMACFGWTAFRASVKSSAPAEIIFKESCEFDARIPNVGMITSGRLAVRDSTSALRVVRSGRFCSPSI